MCKAHTRRGTRRKSRLRPGARKSSRGQLALELDLRMIEILTEGDLSRRDEPSPDRGTSEYGASQIQMCSEELLAVGQRM